MEVTVFCIRLLFNLFLLLTVRGEVILRIDPNQLQFFDYESISLRCAGSRGPTEWRVMKKLPSSSTRWETSTGSLSIKPAFVSDSGEYVCENEEGERSNTINITITGGDVILESPALPVREGDDVVLSCRTRTSSNLPGDFYKDGILFNTEYLGKMTIHNISTSDEGLYKCSVSRSHGESPESRLSVTAADITPTPKLTSPENGQESPSDPPHHGSIQLSVLLLIIFTISCLALLLLVVGLCQRRKHRVLCFSSETPTPGSDPVYEQVGVAVPQAAINSNDTKQKRNRGCQKENVTYADVTVKRTDRVSRESNISDPNKTTYAVIMQRKERGC